MSASLKRLQQKRRPSFSLPPEPTKNFLGILSRLLIFLAAGVLTLLVRTLTFWEERLAGLHTLALLLLVLRGEERR